MKRFKDLKKGDTVYEYYKGMIGEVKVENLIQLPVSGMLFLDDNTGGIYIENLNCSLFKDSVLDRTLFTDLNFKYFLRLEPRRQ